MLVGMSMGDAGGYKSKDMSPDTASAQTRWACHPPICSSSRPPVKSRLIRRRDRIACCTTFVAFPVFGFGVIFGAIWVEKSRGPLLGPVPQIDRAASFIAWVGHAAYLHVHHG